MFDKLTEQQEKTAQTIDNTLEAMNRKDAMIKNLEDENDKNKELIAKMGAQSKQLFGKFQDKFGK